MDKRPTVHDVARAAGVSAMTVSRAVNNKPGVGDELRQRILQLADELGYRPNQSARNLVTNQRATVGLVVPDIANAFFAQIARGAEDEAYERGYTLLLINTGEDTRREQAALETLWQKDLDGVIICSARMPPDELQQQIRRFAAVVLLNRELMTETDHVATITVNDRLGAQLAVRHCISRGCSRIAFAAGPTTSYSAQRRLDGYRDALHEAGIGFDPELIEYCAPTIAGGQTALLTLLERRPRLDAVISFNDLVAIGATETIKRAGRCVPSDVAVIGFDNIPIAGLVRPAVTTVSVDLTQLGRLAMQRLLELISGSSVASATLIDPSLVVRDSA